QACLQPRVAGNVVRLLADLRDSSGHDILHYLWLDAGAGNHRVVDGTEELVGMQVAKPPLLGVTAADRRPRGLDYDPLSTLKLATLKLARCVLCHCLLLHCLLLSIHSQSLAAAGERVRG